MELKWVLAIFFMAIFAILVLPVPILHAIGVGIAKTFSFLIDSVSAKLGASSSYNSTPAATNTQAIIPPPNTANTSKNVSKPHNIIINV